MSESINISEELIYKYAVPCPRYTSYPTAMEFSQEVDNSAWQEILNQHLNTSPSALSLYFHIPFCFHQCYFCACNRITPRSHDVIEPYLDAIGREIAAYQKIFGDNREVEQIHWGGGCPDYLTAGEMRQLFGLISNSFPNINQNAEISVELDPRNLSAEHLSTLAQLGFNRISLGVQDFDSIVQKTINRIQSYSLTADLMTAARKLGLSNINLDLIYGLPNQTLEGFTKTLGQVISLKPSRIALYGYAHVTWVKQVQKVLEHSHLPTPIERIRLFLRALSLLTTAGYRYIGLDHFALPDDELSLALDSGSLNRNFMGYTSHRGSSVIGMGATAISLIPSAYVQNAKDYQGYQKRINEDGFAIERGVIRTVEDQIRGEIIERILCAGQVNFRDIESKYKIDFKTYFDESLSSMAIHQKDQLVEVTNENIQLTPKGRILARNVAMLFDGYLTKYQKSNRPTFSQAV